MATSRSDRDLSHRRLCAKTSRRSRPTVRARPHREPRRDRPPDHPGLSRDGDGGDRCLQRRGCPGPARPGRRPGGADRPGAGGRELPARRRDRRGGPGHRRRRGPSGLRLPGRAGFLRRGGRARRDGLRRTRPSGDRRSRRQARGPSDGDGGRRPRRARDARTGAGRPAGPALGDRRGGRRGRVPAPGQGRRRWWGTGDAPGRLGRRAAGGPPVGLARGRLGLRRRLGLPGAGDPAGAAYRGPAAGRRHGAGRGPRRAGLLAPASSPEAHRGGPGAGPDRDPAARAPRDGRSGLRGGRAAQRRDLRVPVRPGWPVLVPRGQHPAPGRARGDRARDRAGHRPRAVLAGGRGAALRGGAGRRRARGDADEPRDRGPPLGGGPGQGLRAGAGSGDPLGHAGRSGGPGGHGARGRGTDPARLRPADRQAHGPRRGSPGGHRPAAPGPRRDRDRRGPDDPAVRPVRGPRRLVPRGRPLDRLGRRALGRPDRAGRCRPAGAARRRPWPR